MQTRVKLWGGCSQIMGGMQLNYWGISPPSPRVSAPLFVSNNSKYYNKITKAFLAPLKFIDKLYALWQVCPTFLPIRATFTGEKLLRATCIFTKIKLQIIASLLYKIGAHFGHYFGYLSPIVSEDQKKKVFAANRC